MIWSTGSLLSEPANVKLTKVIVLPTWLTPIRVLVYQLLHRPVPTPYYQAVDVMTAALRRAASGLLAIDPTYQVAVAG
jgi:hypothetical protein